MLLVFIVLLQHTPTYLQSPVSTPCLLCLFYTSLVKHITQDIVDPPDLPFPDAF